MTLSPSILGIDLGGTKTAVALFDATTFERLSEGISPTNAVRGYPAVKEDLLRTISAYRTPDTVAIGLGVPGLIDLASGRIMTMPNIPGADGADLRGDIAAFTGLPVVIENDARCFAFSEALVGAGKGRRVVIGVTLGTGVGGGIVVDKKIMRGEHGTAGEIGHMLLVPGQPPYESVNKRGEVEQFLSGTALGKRCAEAKRPQDYLEGGACSFLHPQVFREIAWLVASLTSAFDPSIIVFGGSVGRALGPHMKDIASEVRKWLLPKSPAPDLVCGSLDDAARRGAALLAREVVEKQ